MVRISLKMEVIMRSLYMLIFTTLFAGFFTQALAENIVLFIGDGMGPTYITAGRTHAKGVRGELTLDTLPYTGIVKTYAADNIVTDSAASATAYATGEKVANRIISVGGPTKRGEYKAIKTIAELAKEKGMAVGLVTTTRITHATPASFYAHVSDRDEEKEIARQLLHSEVDLALGGGKRFFNEEVMVENWRFLTVENRRDLWSKGLKSKQPVLGLFHSSHLTYMADRSKEHRQEPRLSDMVKFAIRKLANEDKNFFLMIESGRIDHAGHENKPYHALQELVEFDEAISIALKRLDPANTLVLVTADHETSGLSINGYPTTKQSLFVGKEKNKQVRELEREGIKYPVLSFSTGPNSPYKLSYGNHTGTDIYVYGWGKGAEQVRGTMDNTQLFHIMCKVMECEKQVATR